MSVIIISYEQRYNILSLNNTVGLCSNTLTDSVKINRITSTPNNMITFILTAYKNMCPIPCAANSLSNRSRGLQ